jgi:hypothetical protein
MFELIGIPPQALFGQLLLGLINGAFYAMLSLGLAVIFGMLNVINFTHGAQYMMGAFAAWLLLGILDVPFWASLVLAPILVGLFGVVLERADAEAHLPSRPSLRLPADLRPRPDHRRAVPVEMGFRRRAVSGADPGRHRSRLHGDADLSSLRRGGGARDLPCHLVRHRAHQARRLSAGGDGESHAGPRLRHQRAAPDHAAPTASASASPHSRACWRRPSSRFRR